jgi:uncharacterized protein (DUF2062 family)
VNFARTTKFHYYKLLRLKGSPHSLALGAAIGVFIGLTPTIPLHTTAVLLITFLTRSSIIAGITTSYIISNPFTFIPLYSVCLILGNIATPYHLDTRYLNKVTNLLESDRGFYEMMQAIAGLGYEAVVVFLVGGLILALPGGLLSYFGFYHVIVAFRRKRREKQVLS